MMELRAEFEAASRKSTHLDRKRREPAKTGAAATKRLPRAQTLAAPGRLDESVFEFGGRARALGVPGTEPGTSASTLASPPR